MNPPNPVSADALPDLCGQEALVAHTMATTASVFLPDSDLDFASLRSAFAIALHMHQPLIPAGGGDLHQASIISNLQHMLEHPEIPDAHNATVFRWCYQRMGELIPQLLAEGKSPRVMLDYSGCLLHGLQRMGAADVLDRLNFLANDPACRRCVEWLGTAWGHAVAPSTPVRDFRLHVRAWQHHFASIFGFEALSRVRGFSPPEMALPNHPDVCHEFVRTLLDCGYRWVLLQEHSVQQLDGRPVQYPHLPHRLIARSSRGQSLAITCLIKTQGSDTKLVGQMQPYAEAKTLSPRRLGARDVPPLVTQIGDGENGGVMMNEFPPAFLQAMREASGSPTPALNGTEYLEHLAALGVGDEDFPPVQPLFQDRIWSRFDDGAGPEKLQALLEQLRQEDGRFHMEGGSWTSDISWVRGYENLLGPMAAASALFAKKTRDHGLTPDDPRYRAALFHLLCAQTSCFRYWGQGTWTDYGRELCDRVERALAGTI